MPHPSDSTIIRIRGHWEGGCFVFDSIPNPLFGRGHQWAFEPVDLHQNGGGRAVPTFGGTPEEADDDLLHFQSVPQRDQTG